MVSNSVQEEVSCNLNPEVIYSNELVKNKPEPGRTKVLNPVTEFLTLLFPENSFESGVRNFNLFDINGKSYSKLKMDVPEPIISISLGSVPPGLYLLRIEFKDNVQILKVIITR